MCGFAIHRLFVGLGIMDKPPHVFLSVDVSKWWFGTQECSLLFERDVSNENPGCLGYIGDYTTQLCGDYHIIRNHYKDPYLTTGAEILPKATHLGFTLGMPFRSAKRLGSKFWNFFRGSNGWSKSWDVFFFQLVPFWVAFGSCLNSTGPPRVPFHQACWTEWKNKTLHYTRHCKRRGVRQFGWNWYPGIPPHGSMIMVQWYYHILQGWKWGNMLLQWYYHQDWLIV